MNRLLQLMLALPDKKELTTFMEVFLTDKERAMLAERLMIFEHLRRGKTQREVAQALGCSIVTVTRGAKAYREHQAVIDRWLGGLQTKAGR